MPAFLRTRAALSRFTNTGTPRLPSSIRARAPSRTFTRFTISDRTAAGQRAVPANGAGWHRLQPDSDLGVATAWGEAPAGADQVRAELEGHVLEGAVVSGVYFVVWWDVAPSDPQVSAFRVNGEWVRSPTMVELFQAQRATWLRSRGS